MEVDGMVEGWDHDADVDALQHNQTRQQPATPTRSFEADHERQQRGSAEQLHATLGAVNQAMQGGYNDRRPTQQEVCYSCVQPIPWQQAASFAVDQSAFVSAVSNGNYPTSSPPTRPIAPVPRRVTARAVNHSPVASHAPSPQEFDNSPSWQQLAAGHRHAEAAQRLSMSLLQQQRDAHTPNFHTPSNFTPPSAYVGPWTVVAPTCAYYPADSLTVRQAADDEAVDMASCEPMSHRNGVLPGDPPGTVLGMVPGMSALALANAARKDALEAARKARAKALGQDEIATEDNSSACAATEQPSSHTAVCEACKRAKKTLRFCRVNRNHTAPGWDTLHTTGNAVELPDVCPKCKRQKKGRIYCRQMQQHTEV